MSKEIALKKDVKDLHELSIIEQVVMQGDLSKLNPEQRVTYYNRVCESMGLNPYTRPFDYISLNGKLTLYAKKDATEQLRKVNGISIEELKGQIVDDLYIVTAKAKTPNGRIDQATGAVTIGSLKGDAKANAIMKAETKAKRRVTLSICGMGWTDESEIESIPDAKTVEVDMSTGEIIPIKKNEPKKELIEMKEEAKRPIRLTFDLVKTLSNVIDQCPEVVKAELRADMKRDGHKNFEEMPKEYYDRFLEKAKRLLEDYNKQEKDVAFVPEKLEEVASE